MEITTIASWFQEHAASFIGALLGVKGGEKVGWKSKITAFVLGVAVSYYIGGAIADWLPAKDIARKALELGLGLFAMRIVEAFDSQIAPAMRAFRVKVAGSDPESKKGDLQ